ncbi:MAG: carbohydrate binding family 9 domain-containing protein, partial [Acidobacteria bacterium]|nr:carbohydrate binding family 9 domain-containing protein [Acidobacteriota bacterium]
MSPLTTRTLTALFPLAIIACLFNAAPRARAQQLARLSDDKDKTAGAGASAAARGAESRPTGSRRVVGMRGGGTPNGWRVVVTADSALDDYAARREGSRFVVTLPRADAAAVAGSVGGSLAAARVEQRGADAVISFALPEGYAARVRQSFNRLEVVFESRASSGGEADARQQQQSSGGQSSGSSSSGQDPQQPKPKPTPVTPANNQSESPNAAQPAPVTSDTSTTRETVNAAKKVASAGGHHTVTLPPEKSSPLRIPRFDKAPAIDGKLDDEIWKHAAAFKDFYQTEPGDNIAPSRPTEAFMGYDSHYLYVAFHCYDEPGQVRARVAKRDEIFDDDYVVLFIDTFNDQRKAYEVDFNPLGIQADAIFSDSNGEDFSFDLVGMQSKGAVTSDGFVIEAAIPFKSLKYEAGKDKPWGLHVFRRIKRFNNELDSWMPLSRDVSGWLIQEGRINGLEGISTARTLDLIPSLTLSETGRRVRATVPEPPPGGVNTSDGTRLLNEPVHHDIGVTAKFTLTPTVTLDFTYNPDFAQVEADQTVITANQRFPIFFPEKRPFFLEGKEIFDTQETVVHTRAIIQPQFAAKLTGKRGRNTFGTILASDAGPGNFSEDERLDPANAPFVDKKAYVGVFRVKHDVGRESSVGAFATSYNFIQRHNQLVGLDGRFKLNPKTVASFEVIGTTARRLFRDPDLDPDFTLADGSVAFPGQLRYRNGNGFAYFASLDYTARHFGYFVKTEGRTRDYRADVGFTRQTDTNDSFGAVRFSTEPNPKATLTKFTVQNFTDATYN